MQNQSVRIDQIEKMLESIIENQVAHLAHITLLKEVLEEEDLLPEDYVFQHEMLMQEIHASIVAGSVIDNLEDEEDR